jgi:CheY-like chemotaxis protein
MPRVLVVDDFPDARDLLSGYLSWRGFETEEAVDGEDAIARATEHPPDVILMDIAMPKMDGVEATRRLKEDPRTASVPIIAVTGHAHPPSSVCPPCDAVLVKPVDPVQVEQEILRVLGKSASRESTLGVAKAEGARARAGGERDVWVVDADARVRAAIEHLLGRNGFEVRGFGAPREVLDALRTSAPRAVVVDVALPGDSAVELALSLRDRSELEDLVVVGLEPEDGTPTEIKPLFDGLVARSSEVTRLPVMLQKLVATASPPEAGVSVSVGDRLYARRGGQPFGTVLEVRREFLMVDVAKAGAFVVPATAVASVESGKIVVDPDELDDDLRDAIGE